MTKAMELSLANLRPLDGREQIRYSGGAIPIGWAAVNPYVGIYVGLLTIAYYAGYGAHVVYDAVKE